MSTTKLTQAIVLEFLNYDPSTGILTWKRAPSNCVKAGSVAGSVTMTGHRQVKLLGGLYQAHQLIWFMVYGVWPSRLVDHEDTDPDNNRLHNLREATPQENAHNRNLRSDNQSGFKGVARKGSKWRARIWDGSSNKILGLYDTPEVAAAAYDEAATRLQGAFAKTNKALGLL